MNLDTLIQEDLVNFRREIIECFKVQHAHIFFVVERMFSGKPNMIGIQVTDDGSIVGRYTFVMDGIDVVEVKKDILESAIHHPILGVIKPYVTIERSVIEALVKDESFKKDVFASVAHYLPDFTIRFIR
jgi:hypothetical protein